MDTFGVTYFLPAGRTRRSIIVAATRAAAVRQARAEASLIGAQSFDVEG